MRVYQQHTYLHQSFDVGPADNPAREILAGRPSRSADRREKLPGMVLLMFECPTTGELLEASKRFMRWEGPSDERVSVHCPRCSSTHVLSRADALMRLDSVAVKS